jgi:hypothetical protein
MSERRRIGEIMAEAGPRLDLLQVREYEDRDLWTLLLDEEILVYADYVADRDMLVLSAEVADLPAEGRAARHELLLQYNNQWAETGGVRMALDGPGGTVVQILEMPAAGLGTQTLGTVLSGFAEVLRNWRPILEATPETEGTAGTGPDGPDLGSMIRV